MEKSGQKWSHGRVAAKESPPTWNKPSMLSCAVNHRTHRWYTQWVQNWNIQLQKDVCRPKGCRAGDHEGLQKVEDSWKFGVYSSSSTKCVHPEKLMLSGGSKLTANMDLDYLLISQCILFILLAINNYIFKTILKFKRFISQVLNKVGSHTHLTQKHKQQKSASSSLVFTNHLS